MAEISGAHLVGSAPVDDPDQLFDLVSEHLADHVRRIPDGEVGDRSTWIGWQYPRLAACPQLEAEVIDTGYLGREISQFVISDGAGPLELVELGYADAALSSWKLFEAAQTVGRVANVTRFMVGLPSPLGVVTMYVAPSARAAVLAAWTTAMEGELQRILSAIPSDRLAIQWEVCLEFGTLEGIWTYLDTGLRGDDAKPRIAEHIAYLGNLVPPEVELGYHLCYGDSGHKHFVEPADTNHLAWAATSLIDGVDRPIQWIHMPVPRDRDDVAYFEPLRSLDLPAETELYLGLVHETGGIEGTQSRIDAAAQIVPRFGIATECGLGRRQLASIGPLLDQHASLSKSADTPGEGAPE